MSLAAPVPVLYPDPDHGSIEVAWSLGAGDAPAGFDVFVTELGATRREAADLPAAARHWVYGVPRSITSTSITVRAKAADGSYIESEAF